MVKIVVELRRRLERGSVTMVAAEVLVVGCCMDNCSGTVDMATRSERQNDFKISFKMSSKFV